jgi:hypothetical protein
VSVDAFVQIVGSLAEHQRKKNPYAVGEQDAERARGVTPAVMFQIRQERAQTLRQHGNPVDEILAGAVQVSGRPTGPGRKGILVFWAVEWKGSAKIVGERA